ncbi:MAG TPA: hypothetical protein VL137_04495 [Polyangiaceae bacterium]|nr:hypothetical protein [Polyangiaceae bacterium]
MLAHAAEPTVTPRPEHGYFSVGKPRWFISTKSDIGILYLKPYFSAGYGRPHWIWAGIDANAILTMDMFQSYAGVRAASPIIDLAFGFRDTWSFHRPFLTPAASYSYTDVQRAPGRKARYWAWEAEAVGVAPLPYSALVADLIAIKLLDKPSSRFLYEESYRAIVADSMYAVLRVAAVARLLHENALKIGVLGEHVFETGRSSPVFRVGPIAALQLTDHLEILGVATFAVKSPDSLGLTLGTYGLVGLRYRWATDEPDPKLPWQGTFIP